MASGVLMGLLSTCFTYFLTAVGAGLVYVYDTRANKDRTDKAMAVAVGLMLAAVMELLNETLVLSGGLHFWKWVPLCVGVLLSCVILWAVDLWLARLDESASAESKSGSGVGGEPHAPALDAMPVVDVDRIDDAPITIEMMEIGDHEETRSVGVSPGSTTGLMGAPKTRFDESLLATGTTTRGGPVGESFEQAEATPEELRKAKLLVFALAVQHVPEALACGVAFAGAAADGSNAAWSAAYALTIAIGLQDIPEGATAACVLRGIGMSKHKSFFYGQLTGIGQPIGGVLGALAVVVVESVLPYALAFAGAAMLFVLLKDMIPDVMEKPENRLQYTILTMAAFALMSALAAMMDSIT